MPRAARVPDGFARFVQWRLDRARDDAPRPTGHVPATFLWSVDDADPQTYLGSAAVIEANGGVLEDVRGTKKRYWVPTGTPARTRAGRA